MSESEHLSEEEIFSHFLDTLDGCEDAELQKRIQAQPEATSIYKGFEAMHSQLQQMRVMTLTPGGMSPRTNASLPEKLGNFKVLGKIGEGGMGLVLKAFDPSLGRVVAIKLLKNQKGNIPQQQRFQREAQTIARLKHDNIVQVYALEFSAEGDPFIVMEYLPGQNLRREVDPKSPWTPQELQAFWRPLLEALVHAHQKGILHRDIKPDNLLRERDHGQIKIVDFGISKWCHEDPLLTGHGLPIGTLPYMSPEQIRGEELGESADIYSLALTMVEMILGERPLKSSNPVKLLEEINRGIQFSNLRQEPLWAEKTQWLDLLKACCHPEAQKRPKGEDLLARLKELEKKPTSTKTQNVKSRSVPIWIRMAVAMLACLGLVLLAHYALQPRGEELTVTKSLTAHSPSIQLNIVMGQGSGLKPELAVELQQIMLRHDLQGGYQWGQGSTQCQITCTLRGDRIVFHLQLNGQDLNFSKSVEQALVVNVKPSLDKLIISLNDFLSHHPFQP
jgi:serine/threonine protein kinase